MVVYFKKILLLLGLIFFISLFSMYVNAGCEDSDSTVSGSASESSLTKSGWARNCGLFGCSAKDEDNCSGNKINESYCSSFGIFGSKQTTTKDCPSATPTCLVVANGGDKCVSSCTDSDSSQVGFQINEIYEAGEVNYDGTVYKDVCQADTEWITERSCNSVGFSSTGKDCGDGYTCKLLNNDKAFCSSVCEDSDSSSYGYKAGDLRRAGRAVKGTSNGNVNTYNDECSGTTHISEAYCNNAITLVRTGDLPCGDGYECKTTQGMGYCAPIVATCSDTCSVGEQGCSSGDRWICGEARDGDDCLERVSIACGEDEICQVVSPTQSICEATGPVCPNTICEAGETCNNCPADCGACGGTPNPCAGVNCGVTYCSDGNTLATPYCSGGTCATRYDTCTNGCDISSPSCISGGSCTAQCDGKCGGDDTCGGNCVNNCPSETPFCVDGSQCGECAQDSDCSDGKVCTGGACFEDGCSILQAFWSLDGVNELEEGQVEDGNVVFMIVKGTSDCTVDDGVSFKIKKDLLIDTEVPDFSGEEVKFNEEFKIVNFWVADRNCLLGCLLGDPSFYFEADHNGDIVVSGNIEVLLDDGVADCGDGLIEIGEVCDKGQDGIPGTEDDVLPGGENECSDHEGWNGGLIGCSFDCFTIDTSGCEGPSGNCGDEVLNPGEYCEPGTIGYGDEIIFDDIIDCSSVPDNAGIFWEGRLDCYPSGHEKQCLLDISSCIDSDLGLGGSDCPTCESCGDNIDCSVDICQRSCAGGFGSCHYTGAISSGGDCESCLDVDSCDDYETPFSCGTGGTDTCNLGADPDWDGFFCEWVGGASGQCKKNLDCRWNCDGLFGQCQGDGFKYRQNNGCELIAGESIDVSECLSSDPTNNFPEKVACGILEENFPVFTFFNLIISILLFGLYYSRKRS